MLVSVYAMGIVEWVLNNATLRRLALRNMMFRPPSEHNAVIVQGTVGCSWNHCSYCLMYREKKFAIRPVELILADLHKAAGKHGYCFCPTMNFVSGWAVVSFRRFVGACSRPFL